MLQRSGRVLPLPAAWNVSIRAMCNADESLKAQTAVMKERALVRAHAKIDKGRLNRTRPFDRVSLTVCVSIPPMPCATAYNQKQYFKKQDDRLLRVRLRTVTRWPGVWAVVYCIVAV